MAETAELAPLRRENLQKWMDENEVSRSELSVKLGVGRAYVSLLFNPTRFLGEKSARSMERKLGLPSGYLDTEGGKPVTVDSWETPSDLSEGFYGLVHPLSVVSTSGNEFTTSKIAGSPPFAFKKSWMQEKLITRRENLCFVVAHGDSMASYICDGDTALVDSGQKDLVDMEPYAINYGGDIRIRRLSRRFDGGLVIRSDNAKYPEEYVGVGQADQISIIGRVIWRCG